MLSSTNADEPIDMTQHMSQHIRPRVLVIEDDAHIRELVGLHLRLEELDVSEAADGQKGLELARSHTFDVIVLDLMLPGVDGVTLCRAVRRDSPNIDTPILMLTARREESDKVLGLDSGADDYLTKPFGVREMTARVRALLRRGRSTQIEGLGNADKPVTYREIHMDPARRKVTVGSRDVELTSQEFQLLYLLLSHPGIVFSREALLRKIWKGETFVTDRTVDTLVKRLRKKIEPHPRENEVILTVWGAGYKAADV